MSKPKPAFKLTSGWPLVVLVAVVAALVVAHVYTKPSWHRLRYLTTHSEESGLLRYQIRADSGTARVNAVQARGTYTDDSLEFVGVDSVGSAFSIAAEGKGENGTFSVARGSTASITGDHVVATLLFRARGSSASTAVSLKPADSVIVDTATTKNILGQPGVKLYIKEVK